MNDAALHLAALALSTVGMALFALAIEPHWQQLFGRRPHPRALRVRLRIGGGALLAAGFALCALADPVTMAALVWPMLLAVAGAIVAAALTLHARPR